MAGVQIRSSLITTLRISPTQGVRKRLLLILSKKSLTPLYIIVTGVKKSTRKIARETGLSLLLV